VQLALLGTADYSLEVASRRADGLVFDSDHRGRGGGLVASHCLAGVDPGRLAGAKLLTESVGGFDNIGRVRRDCVDVGLQFRGNIEDERWRDVRKRGCEGWTVSAKANESFWPFCCRWSFFTVGHFPSGRATVGTLARAFFERFVASLYELSTVLVC
jgi:hypothetical protein